MALSENSLVGKPKLALSRDLTYVSLHPQPQMTMLYKSVHNPWQRHASGKYCSLVCCSHLKCIDPAAEDTSWLGEPSTLWVDSKPTVCVWLLLHSTNLLICTLSSILWEVIAYNRTERTRQRFIYFSCACHDCWVSLHHTTKHVQLT